MPREYLQELISFLKSILTLGFLTMAVFTVAIAYELYRKFLKYDEVAIKKHGKLFHLSLIPLGTLPIFIYTFLFLKQTL